MKNLREPRFRCDRCSKAFHRKDALNKHEETHALTASSLLRRGARACSSCASMKSPCSGTLPCVRSTTKKLQCVYPATRSRSAVEGSVALQEQPAFITGDSPSSPPPGPPQLEQESYGFSNYNSQPGQARYEPMATVSQSSQNFSQSLPAGIPTQQPSYQDAPFYPAANESTS